METTKHDRRLMETGKLRRAFNLTAEFTAVEDGWIMGRCLEVPGAITQGETTEEARDNLREAVELMLEGYTAEELEELRKRSILGMRETINL